MTTSADRGPRRLREQRWLIDETIRVRDIEFDQPRGRARPRSTACGLAVDWLHDRVLDRPAESYDRLVLPSGEVIART